MGFSAPVSVVTFEGSKTLSVPMQDELILTEQLVKISERCSCHGDENPFCRLPVRQNTGEKE